MSNFLINLALRGAGVPAAAAPRIPALWNQPELAALKLEEIVEERPAPHPAPVVAREPEVRAPQASVEAPASHVAPPPPVLPPVKRESPPIPIPPPVKRESPPIPIPPPVEHTRELQVEHRDVVREPATAPRVEVHEVVHEKEIVREKVVDRELRSESPHPGEPVTVRPPVLHSTAEATTRDWDRPAPQVIREVVEKPVPAAPNPIVPPPAPAREIVQQPAGPLAEKEDRTGEQPHRELPARPAHPVPRSQPVPQKIAAPGPPKPATYVPALRTPDPVLRPAPPPEVAIEVLARPPQVARPEKSVEVKIGSIEIRAAAPLSPPPARVAENTTVAREPVEGFEQYRSMRQYSTWFRE